MNLDTLNKKCESCGLFLKRIEFHKNKSKADGLHNRCKDCMTDYMRKLRKGLIEKQPLLKKDKYYIPDIYIVGYGRQQTYQVCCLSCSSAFFCMFEVKELQDLFCDNCQADETKLPDRNIASVNLVGNVVGWLCKTENPTKNRTSTNYKKCYHRDRYTCQYCGYNMENAKKFLPLHIDHIKPWSAQGGNALKNLVVACQECNLIASDKWFSSFGEKKDYILSEKKKRASTCLKNDFSPQ